LVDMDFDKMYSMRQGREGRHMQFLRNKKVVAYSERKDEDFQQQN